MPANETSSEVFGRLRAILQELAPQLAVTKDEPRFYWMHTKPPGRREKPYIFGAVLAMDDGVKIHLPMLRSYPDLREQVSPELRRYTPDQTIFIFPASGADLTDVLLAELAGLAKTCLDRLKQDRRAERQDTLS